MHLNQYPRCHWHILIGAREKPISEIGEVVFNTSIISLANLSLTALFNLSTPLH